MAKHTKRVSQTARRRSNRTQSLGDLLASYRSSEAASAAHTGTSGLSASPKLAWKLDPQNRWSYVVLD